MLSFIIDEIEDSPSLLHKPLMTEEFYLFPKTLLSFFPRYYIPNSSFGNKNTYSSQQLN